MRFDGRILRVVRADFAEELAAFLETRAARDAGKSGRLISSWRLPPNAVPALELPPGEALYEHERVLFPSYPYEWAPEMLQAAGFLTLDLALATLEEGFGLKDATPYNV